ncbi:hypothetical protein ACET3Z_021039 [Daucus carota]
MLRTFIISFSLVLRATLLVLFVRQLSIGLFISDKVYSGFVRTRSHFWGFESHGVLPDIVTMAKDRLDGQPEVLLDPNELSEDGTVALISV